VSATKSADFGTLSPTFPLHCDGLNFIRVTQSGLSQTCHRLCRIHLDMLRWFESATFVIFVHDFPWREVLVKVSIIEFGLNSANTVEWTVIRAVTYL